MLNRLIGKSGRHQSTLRTPPHVSDGTRVYAIGDIHGCAQLLEEMMHLIQIDRKDYHGECWTIFLGDYINRGSSSLQVMKQLAEMAMKPRHVFLMGNHEEILLKIIDGNENLMRFFIRIGGRETIISYGMSVDQFHKSTYRDLNEYIKFKIPDDHVSLLRSMKSQFIIDDYIFVHAGVDLEKSPLDQDPMLTRWIREGFIDLDFDYPKTVVHGHTIFDDVTLGHSRIGIDTGAYLSGRLSALVLEGSNQRILQTGAKSVY